MKRNRPNLFWGVVLILVGGFFLAVNTDIVPELTESIWGMIFAIFALLFFVGYLSSDRSQWGLLFPGTLCGAIALTFWLNTADVEGTIIGGSFLIVVSIPFWIGYLVNRQKHWGLLIPAWIMAIIGVILLFVGERSDEWIGALILFAFALPFFVVFLNNRKHWWALIPGWVMSVLGVIVLLADSANGELIGALFMFAVALPFFVVYFINRKHWWAIIPGWVTAVLGVIILLANTADGELIGALFMFAIALPFLVVYWVRRENWWALIPAGVLSTIGVVVLLTMADLSEAAEVRVIGGAMFAGIGVTFGLLWLLRHQYETDWAKYPAVALCAAALLVIVTGIQFEYVGPVLLIGIGLWLLISRSSQPTEKSLPK